MLAPQALLTTARSRLTSYCAYCLTFQTYKVEEEEEEVKCTEHVI